MSEKKTEKLLFSKAFIYLFSAVILLSYCYLNNISFLPKFIQYLSIFLSFTVIFFYIIYFKFSKVTVTISVFIFIGFIATILGSNAEILLFFKNYYRILAICYFLDWGLRNNSLRILKCLKNIFIILIFINFFTIIKYPYGLYRTQLYTTNWFFGYDNLHIFFYMPALMLSLIDLNIKNKYIDLYSVFLIFLCSYCVYYCFSATSVVGYSLFLFYFVFRKKINKINIMNGKSYLIMYYSIFIFIVVLRLQNLFSWLIVDILNKKLTFSNRTILWDRIKLYIYKKPFLGYGNESDLIITRKLGEPTFTHAHNTILDILYKGGILMLIPFIYLLHIVIKELDSCKDLIISKSCSFVLFCSLVMMNFEAREDKIGLYIILLFCASVKYFKNNINTELNNEQIVK